MLIRNHILHFAEKMEGQMIKHDFKKKDTWLKMNKYTLNDLFFISLDKYEKARNRKAEQKQLINMSNYCMMLYYQLENE